MTTEIDLGTDSATEAELREIVEELYNHGKIDPHAHRYLTRCLDNGDPDTVTRILVRTGHL